MIEKLNKEAVKQLNVYREKYIKIGLDTSPFTLEETEKIATWLDVKLNRKNSKVIIMDGPTHSYLGVLMLFIANKFQQQMTKTEIDKSLKDNSEMIVSNDILENIADKISSVVGDDWIHVKPLVINTILKEFQQNKKINFVYPNLLGQFDVSFFAFYDFMKNVLGVNHFPKDYENLRELINFNLIYPIEGYIIFCQKPEIILRNERGLHCENGPALRYQDGTEIWALNGVKMPSEYILTPKEELEPNLILKEKNAEIRRELVRKITLEKLFATLPSKIIDKKSYKSDAKLTSNNCLERLTNFVNSKILNDKNTIITEYELITIDIGDDRFRPYLRMKNPSTGDLHIEGVHPDCKTVEDALAWRNQLDIYIPPENLS